MLPEEDYLKVIDHTPLVSIDLVILNASGQVLLGMRNNQPARGCWFVPGGVIRKNEKISRAMKRISLAELGFQIDPDQTQHLGAYEHFYTTNFAEADGISTHYVVLGYSCQIDDSQVITQDNQHEALQWWDIDTLLSSTSVHTNTKAYFPL